MPLILSLVIIRVKIIKENDFFLRRHNILTIVVVRSIIGKDKIVNRNVRQVHILHLDFI
jgi:hypothetical protein